MVTASMHFGLTPIYTNQGFVDIANIISVIEETYPQYELNKYQILSLKEIYKGNQAILSREQTASALSNEVININLLPNLIETVSSLTLGEKIDYAYNGTENNSDKSEDVSTLIRILRHNSDILVDKYSMNDLLICGVAYQFASENPKSGKDILLTNLPCENVYVVRANTISKDVVLSVIVGETIYNNEPANIYTCFTDDYKFVIIDTEKGKKIESVGINPLPNNPVQEIKYNEYYHSLVARLEAVINTFNLTISDCVNASIQQIRSMLLIQGAELNKENIELAKQTGVLNVVGSDGTQVSATYVFKPLDQSIVDFRQMLIDLAEYIAGVPKTGGMSGNTGGAYIGSGMQTLNQKAYYTMQEFSIAKKNIIDNILSVLRRNGKIKTEINSYDIDMTFDRNMLIDIVAVADAFMKFIASGLPSREALKVVGAFTDIEKIAMQMEEMIKAKTLEQLEKETQDKTLKEETQNKTVEPEV